MNPKENGVFINSKNDSLPVPVYLAEIVDLANNAVITFDPQGRVTFWNLAAERLYGWAANEVIGKSSGAFLLPLNTPQELEEYKKNQTELDAGTTLRGESRVRRKDGSLFWIEYTNHATFDEKGKVREYVAIQRDITERKRIEDEITLMAKMPSENPNPVMRLTPDGEIVYANEASKPLLDYWKQQTGKMISDVVQKGIDEAYKSGSKKVVEIEFAGKTFSCTLAPIPDADYINFYGSDITNRKLVEESLLQERLHAERATEQLERLQRVTAALSEAITPKQVARVLTLQGVPALNARRGTVLALSEDGQVLNILHTTYIDSVTTPYRHFSVASNVPAADAVRSGQPVWIKSREEYKERYPHLVEQIEAWNLQAAVAIPLVVKNRKLGVLTLSFEQIHEFSAEDRDFALNLAQQGAQALERAQLYRKMRRALSELQATYDQSPIGMIQLDTDLRYIRVNETLALLNGIPAAEHIGKSIWEIVPDLAPKIEEGFRKVIETGEPVFNVEVLGETKAEPGVPHVWFESWYPLRGDSGKVLGLNVVVQDITKSKKDEHALAEFVRQQAALYKLADKLLRTKNLKETFDAALDAILDALQCDRASILLFDDSGSMHFVAWRGLSTAYRAAADGHSPWDPHTADPIPICYNEVDSSELSDSLKSVIQTEGIVSLAFIPLVFDGKLIGKFMMYFDTQHTFTPKELDLSLTIAHQLAFGIQRQRGEERLHESQEQLRALNESLEQRVREQTAEVRQLASDLTKAEQRERRRIAHILHEDLQQRFYAIQMQVEFLLDKLARENESFQGDFDQIRKRMKEVISLTRHLSVDLSPPILGDEGLTQAVEWLASQMEEQYKVQVQVRAEKPLVILDKDVELLLFNCVRELLFNVVKHAQVDQAEVFLGQLDGNYQVEVRDAGRGFEVDLLPGNGDGLHKDDEGAQRTFGLPTIRHRLNLFGGRMEIQSAPGAGTQVTLTIPAQPKQTDL